MPANIVSSIQKQTQVLFINLESTLNSLDAAQLESAGSWGWPLGQQVFHLLRSLDQWFINPEAFVENDRLKAMAGLTTPTLPELKSYYIQVKTKIETYLSVLDENELTQCPAGCQFTRIELILGQYRHFMYHIGLIHGCLRSVSGNSPAYTGLK